jgi:hypothetical protein
VGTGSAPGIITDYSEIFLMDNWKMVLVRGTCGIADRGGVST